MNHKQKNMWNKGELTQRFNHELIQIMAILQPGVDHCQIDLSLLHDGHSENRTHFELINLVKSLELSGEFTPEVDNLIPVIEVAQRPATQVRKYIAAIRNKIHLPADSSAIPDSIRDVCLSNLTVPALSQDPSVRLVLVSVENIDLIIDEQITALNGGGKTLTSYW